MDGEKFTQWNKIILITAGSIVGALIIIYLLFSAYFNNRFYFGTFINGVKVTGKTVSQVEEEFKNDDGYLLELKCRDNNTEIISGKDIDFQYHTDNKIQKIKDSQNSFAWITGLFKRNDIESELDVSYDEDKLKEIYSNLSCFKDGNIVEPQNPVLNYNNGSYEITPEIKGNRIKKDVLYNLVSEALKEKKSSLDAEKLEVYENPQYTKESKELSSAKEIMDKYVSAKITYTRGNSVVAEVNGDKIKDWILVDENYNVSLSQDKVMEFICEIDNVYDTAGVSRSFRTSEGNTISISGGDYGWVMNNAEECTVLYDLVSNGSTETREPVYLQTGSSYDDNEIGGTYVEVNLTKQHLWFYVNGALVTEGDVVTGNGNSAHATPPGVYKLDYKERNATLTGPGYSTKVSYWMPFNKDIGIHDATWRKEFGGNIYMGNGSHGCVNAPYNVAEAIFNNISAGNPVVCYK